MAPFPEHHLTPSRPRIGLIPNGLVLIPRTVPLIDGYYHDRHLYEVSERRPDRAGQCTRVPDFNFTRPVLIGSRLVPPQFPKIGLVGVTLWHFSLPRVKSHPGVPASRRCNVPERSSELTVSVLGLSRSTPANRFAHRYPVARARQPIVRADLDSALDSNETTPSEARKDSSYPSTGSRHWSTTPRVAPPIERESDRRLESITACRRFGANHPQSHPPKSTADCRREQRSFVNRPIPKP